MATSAADRSVPRQCLWTACRIAVEQGASKHGYCCYCCCCCLGVWWAAMVPGTIASFARQHKRNTQKHCRPEQGMERTFFERGHFASFSHFSCERMLLSGFCGSQLATQPLCLSCLYSSRAAVDVFRSVSVLVDHLACSSLGGGLLHHHPPHSDPSPAGRLPHSPPLPTPFPKTGAQPPTAAWVCLIVSRGVVPPLQALHQGQPPAPWPPGLPR